MHGLGAALLQNGQPVGYVSRSLTECERKYAQIEKELLAIQFGLEHFDHYTYGRKVCVDSDHKPLEMIYRKPLQATPKRLQRMLLWLQRYDVQIQYRRGTEMHIADTLSRAALPDTERNCKTHEQVLSFDEAVDYLPMKQATIELLRQATSHDQNLQELKATIQQGWPSDKAMVTPSVRQYFTYCTGMNS